MPLAAKKGKKRDRLSIFWFYLFSKCQKWHWCTWILQKQDPSDTKQHYNRLTDTKKVMVTKYFATFWPHEGPTMNSTRYTRQRDMGRNTKPTIWWWWAASLLLPLETIHQASYRIKQASVVCQDSKWHPLWGVWHLAMSRGTSQAGDSFNRDRPWRSACLSFQHLQLSHSCKPLHC